MVVYRIVLVMAPTPIPPIMDMETMPDIAMDINRAGTMNRLQENSEF